MSANAASATQDTVTWRVAPSVPVAAGVFIVYVVVFIGLAATAGIDYDEWFDTGANAFRTAVVPLIGGSLVLIAFLLWARWDWVFKDPARLPMYDIFRLIIATLLGFLLVETFARVITLLRYHRRDEAAAVTVTQPTGA